MYKERYNMEPFKRIFIHCSDSDFGTALLINEWHIKRGWKCIGYNEVVNNGYPSFDYFNNNIKIPYAEGAVEFGRVADSDQWFESFEEGAGVYGWNKGSYHICMIGKFNFSDDVLNKTLEIVRYRMKQFNLTYNDVFGHYEKDDKKTCPNIDMNIFRSMLKDNKNYGDFIKKKTGFIDIIKMILNGMILNF